MMKLTEHFTLQEFTYSELLDGHLVPTALQVERVYRLCTSIIEPLRHVFGPIRIGSGIRNTEVYTRIKLNAEGLRRQGYMAPIPSKVSDHFAGDDMCPNGTGAGDLVFLDGDPREMAERAFEFMKGSELPFKQAIFYPAQKFMHVANAVLGNEPRRECKIYMQGEYIKVR